MHHLLHDIGIAIILATVMGLTAQFLRQPVILGYLVAGAVAGPLGFGWVQDSANIGIISEIGLILLLFVIGLEMNLTELKTSGRALLVAGLGQFPLCVLIALPAFALIGLPLWTGGKDGLYLALVSGLSSTAIVIKLLYDKGELDTLPGRVTLGILLAQDVFAILVLAFQPNFTEPSLLPLVTTLGGTAVLLGAGFLISRHLLSRLFHAIGRSPEMVVATSLAWCAAVAGLAGTLGLSKELGALVAGLSISAFPYSVHVTAKTLPLRDFFLTLFFVALGLKIVVPTSAMVVPLIVLVAVTMLGRFVVLHPLMALAGAGRRTAFLAAVNLGQVSEFGLVIAAIGLHLGHITSDTMAVVIYGMAITAVLSSYAIRASHPLYALFQRVIGAPVAESSPTTAIIHPHPVMLLGYHRIAQELISVLRHRDEGLLQRIQVIDFNTEHLAQLRAQGIAGRFGDLSSADTLHHLGLHHAGVVICTIPDSLLKGTTNATLVEAIRRLAPEAVVIATAENAAQAQRLRDLGAAEVLAPHHLAGIAAADAIDAVSSAWPSMASKSLLRSTPGV